MIFSFCRIFTKKQNTFVLICSYFIFLYNLNSQIVNEGTLQIENSTIVYFGDEYTNNGTHNNNGDLYLNSNFINNDSTFAIAGTTFFKSSINNIQRISGLKNKIHFYNLEINNELTGVEVVDDFGLIVTNSVNLMDGDLRLKGDAQLVQTHNGADLNSSTSGKLLRDQQGNRSSYAFNYWSSPVNNGGTFSIGGGLFDGTDANLNPFTPQQVLFNSGAPYNGAPSIVDGSGKVTTALTLNSSWFYEYARGSGTIAEWIKINQNSTLNPGIGFTMKGTNTANATQNYVFKGVPNDGDYQFVISAGEYSLLGNPYPSAIYSDEFILDNISIGSGGNATTDVITGTLYFWVEGGSTSHSYSGYLGGYATYNLTAGAPPSAPSRLISGLGTSELAPPPTKYMAVSQGFFVIGAGNSNIEFKNSQRVFKTESSGETVHYKNSITKNTSEKSIIRIGYEDPEGFHRQLVLGFLPNTVADLNYNLAYDALMFDEREDELYFIIENDLTKKYVIQGVGAFDETIELPLGLKITEEGTHNVMLDATENFDNVVYIRDKLLNRTHNLTESKLELNVSADTFSDRFQLVFQPQSTLDIHEFEKNKINVYYNGEHSIIINNQNRLILNKVSIFNILGQKILQFNDSSLSSNEIILPFRKKEGVYLVKIESEIGEATYKILKINNHEK